MFLYPVGKHDSIYLTYSVAISKSEFLIYCELQTTTDSTNGSINDLQCSVSSGEIF